MSEVGPKVAEPVSSSTKGGGVQQDGGAQCVADCREVASAHRGVREGSLHGCVLKHVCRGLSGLQLLQGPKHSHEGAQQVCTLPAQALPAASS